MTDPTLTQTLAALNTAIAALRYCQKHHVDLPEEMPDHFDEGDRVTEQDIDLVVEQLNHEWSTIALDSLIP